MGGRDLYWLGCLSVSYLCALQSSLSTLQYSLYHWAQNTTFFFRSMVFLYVNSGELLTF